MKMIAITQRIDYISDYGESRDALDNSWWEIFKTCQLLPIIIPNDITLTKNIFATHSIDGIILSGGNETPSRHEVEKYLLEIALKKSLPTLGVCHGMQMIQQYFGIQLNKITDHIHSEQEILIHDQPCLVNSYHDYGTNLTHDYLQVWARAYDGTIKAIKHVDFPITGIMWHPERVRPFAERDITLIKTIFHGAN